MDETGYGTKANENGACETEHVWEPMSYKYVRLACTNF